MGRRPLQRPPCGCLGKGSASSARRRSRSPSAARRTSLPSPTVTGHRPNRPSRGTTQFRRVSGSSMRTEHSVWPSFGQHSRLVLVYTASFRLLGTRHRATCAMCFFPVACVRPLLESVHSSLLRIISKSPVNLNSRLRCRSAAQLLILQHRSAVGSGLLLVSHPGQQRSFTGRHRPTWPWRFIVPWVKRVSIWRPARARKARTAAAGLICAVTTQSVRTLCVSVSLLALLAVCCWPSRSEGGSSSDREFCSARH